MNGKLKRFASGLLTGLLVTVIAPFLILGIIIAWFDELIGGK